MPTFLNKQSLKNETYKIMDELDKLTGKLMSPGCSDDATGQLRAEIYSALNKCHEKLEEITYKIY